MEMINSYCAAINGGYLLQPYVVDKVVDEDGNVVLKNERTVKRQVISEDTSAKIRDALERVVTDNNGGNVTIKGYSIGGKSGTSQRLSLTSDKDEDQEYAASYVCFTPADDPEIILLVMADMPDKEIGYYGSTVAVPTARDILTDVLPYLGFSPEYTDEEVENLDVKVPLLEGKLTSAIATLEDLGVDYVVIGDGEEVVAQSPVTSSSIAQDGCVYLYTEENATEYTEVPDFKGMDASWANETAQANGLNFVATGASTERSDSVVSSQSIAAGTKVPKGTVVELEFMVYQNSD
jgi:stage V sporulation protein D (sporulation-specific penicillin-binding protein)